MNAIRIILLNLALKFTPPSMFLDFYTEASIIIHLALWVIIVYNGLVSLRNQVQDARLI